MKLKVPETVSNISNAVKNSFKNSFRGSRGILSLNPPEAVTSNPDDGPLLSGVSVFVDAVMEMKGVGAYVPTEVLLQLLYGGSHDCGLSIPGNLQDSQDLVDLSSQLPQKNNLLPIHSSTVNCSEISHLGTSARRQSFTGSTFRPAPLNLSTSPKIPKSSSIDEHTPRKSSKSPNCPTSKLRRGGSLPMLPLSVNGPVSASPWRVQPIVRQFQGAILMMDVSGFTKMCDDASKGLMPKAINKVLSRRNTRSLTQSMHPNSNPNRQTLNNAASALRIYRTNNADDLKGQGAEGVREVLNTFFGELMNLIEGHNGDVLRVAGDAIIVVFNQESGVAGTDESEKEQVVTQLATLCAWTCVNDETASDLGLAVHAGAATGLLSSFHVGKDQMGMQFVVCGQPLVEVADAVDISKRKEVLVTDRMFEILQKDGWTGQGAMDKHNDPRPGLMRLTGQGNKTLDSLLHLINRGSTRAELLQHFTMHTSKEDLQKALRNYAPLPVLSSILLDSPGELHQNRKISVLFGLINLSVCNADSEPKELLERLQAIFTELQTACCRFGGVIKEFSVDDKGLVLVAGFGMSLFQGVHSAARACLCAIEAETALRAIGEKIFFGITTGPVFCASLGSDQRKEFAMVSDTVNMAARLMCAAQKESLWDPESVVLRSSSLDKGNVSKSFVQISRTRRHSTNCLQVSSSESALLPGQSQAPLSPLHTPTSGREKLSPLSPLHTPTSGREMRSSEAKLLQSFAPTSNKVSDQVRNLSKQDNPEGVPSYQPILIDEPTFLAAKNSPHLSFKELPPIMVKGKANAISIFSPVVLTSRSEYEADGTCDISNVSVLSAVIKSAIQNKTPRSGYSTSPARSITSFDEKPVVVKTNTRRSSFYHRRPAGENAPVTGMQNRRGSFSSIEGFFRRRSTSADEHPKSPHAMLKEKPWSSKSLLKQKKNTMNSVDDSSNQFSQKESVDLLSKASFTTLLPLLLGDALRVEEQATEILWLRTQGNALKLREMALHLKEQKLGYVDDSKWWLWNYDLRSLLEIGSVLPGGLQDEYGDRFAKLSGSAKLVMKIASVLGTAAQIKMFNHLLMSCEPYCVNWLKRVEHGSKNKDSANITEEQLSGEHLIAVLTGLERKGYLTVDFAQHTVHVCDLMMLDAIYHEMPVNIRIKYHIAAAEFFSIDKPQIALDVNSSETSALLPMIIHHYTMGQEEAKATHMLKPVQILHPTKFDRWMHQNIHDWMCQQSLTTLEDSHRPNMSLGLACALPWLRGLAKCRHGLQVGNTVISAAMKFNLKAKGKSRPNSADSSVDHSDVSATRGSLPTIKSSRRKSMSEDLSRPLPTIASSRRKSLSEDLSPPFELEHKMRNFSSPDEATAGYLSESDPEPASFFGATGQALDMSLSGSSLKEEDMHLPPQVRISSSGKIQWKSESTNSQTLSSKQSAEDSSGKVQLKSETATSQLPSPKQSAEEKQCLGELSIQTIFVA